MSDLEQSAAGTKSTLESLRGRIEDAALESVLGKLDPCSRIPLFRELADEADLAGRPDLADPLREVLQAVSRTTNAAEVSALLTDCIARVQQLLCNPAHWLSDLYEHIIDNLFICTSG
jgi:hypothetical protein